MKSTALQFFWLFPISLYKFSLAGDKCRHFWTSTKFIILRKKKQCYNNRKGSPTKPGALTCCYLLEENIDSCSESWSWGWGGGVWREGGILLLPSLLSFHQEKLQGKCPFIAVVWSQSFLALSSFLAMQGVSWSF